MSQPEANPAPARELTEVELERKRRKDQKAAEKAARKAAAKARKPAAKAQPVAKKASKNDPRLRNKEFVNTVPKGHKKPVTTRLEDMAKTYDVAAVESAWYDWWLSQGYFQPPAEPIEDEENNRFVMIIPPPNVTGALHLGHALTESIQDTLVRWHRMSGRSTLWVPGSDHAGISCQDVVEKKLMRELGKTRHDFTREEFVAKIWEWRTTYGERIFMQLRRLGISADWERVFFTLDDNLNVAVEEAFMRLNADGLIYRDRRLVNWCCKLNTAISDIEVDHKELEGPTHLPAAGHDAKKKYPFGVLEHFAYKIDGEEGEIEVATTRIETMLGDTAVAVHPEDDRYKHLHGKFLIHPYSDRKIPIVTDSEAVKMDFGTGAVKITPAHDPNDYAVGQRHKLEFITVFTDEGAMNDFCPEQFKGMMRFDCRVAIIADLKAKELHRGTTPNPMTIGVCSRTGDVVEPMIKPQWWVDCKEMARKAVEAVDQGDLTITPERHIKTWKYFLDNIRDWCISRQLVWGHRIPAYFVAIEGQAPLVDTTDSWVIARTEDEARTIAAKRHNVPEAKITLTQDPDVLDTWFSSSLLPFSTMGWPNDSVDLERFFPNQLLETGHDIIFFWVARMVMMSQKLTGKLPFKQVYLHAMVRDSNGKKMSKSKGNVVDPIDVIEGITLADMHAQLTRGNLDPSAVASAKAGQKKNFPDGISECGTDALRFGLCNFTSNGQSINLNINKVIKFRNFCNKLWNATRFIMMNLGEGYKPPASAQCQTGDELPVEKWVLARLNECIVRTVAGLQTYDFHDATEAVYNFLLQDVCGVYVEVIKPVVNDDAKPDAQASVRNTLYTCLETGFRLLHPFMPFITEELWQRLERRAGDKESIMISAYPAPVAAWEQEEAKRRVEQALEVMGAVRSLRAAYGLTARNKLPLYIRAHSQELAEVLEESKNVFEVLCFAPTVQVISKDADTPAGCAVKIFSEHVQVYLALTGQGLDLDKELTKLKNKVTKLQREHASLTKKMGTTHYAEKVPADVRQEDEEKVSSLESEIEVFQGAIKTLEDIVAGQ